MKATRTGRNHKRPRKEPTPKETEHQEKKQPNPSGERDTQRPPAANKAEECSGDKQKGNQQRQATLTEKTEAEAIRTRPKGRPRRDGNRRFERVRKENLKPQQQSKAGPAEKEAKPERRTPQQARRETVTRGEKAAQGTRKNPKQAVTTIRKKTSRNAGKQHPDNLGIAKENSQHGENRRSVKAKSRRRCRIRKNGDEDHRQLGETQKTENR